MPKLVMKRCYQLAVNLQSDVGINKEVYTEIENCKIDNKNCVKVISRMA